MVTYFKFGDTPDERARQKVLDEVEQGRLACAKKHPRKKNLADEKTWNAYAMLWAGCITPALWHKWNREFLIDWEAVDEIKKWEKAHYKPMEPMVRYDWHRKLWNGEISGLKYTKEVMDILEGMETLWYQTL